MATILDGHLLDDDIEEARSASDAARWTLERGNPLEVVVTLSPQSEQQEVYRARLMWVSYPGRWPSLKFLTADGRTDDPRAWPACDGFRPGSFDSCVHWTSEGHGLHPEWATDARTRCPDGVNLLLECVAMLQDSLDYRHHGRFKP